MDNTHSAKVKDFKDWSIAAKMRVIFSVMLVVTLLIAAISGATVFWLSGSSDRYMTSSANVMSISEIRADVANTLWHAREYSAAVEVASI